MPFADRREAGQQLARLAERYADEDPLVLGLARGGVPVAYELAQRLGCDLDVFVARKIGAPGHPEFGIGALAPGVRLVDEASVRATGATESQVDQIASDEAMEMERRYLAYRGEREPPDVRGRTVILVDDGLATGVTARAAVRSLRRLGAKRVVLAVPVAARDSAEAIRDEVDDLLVLETPVDFGAVGLWYDRFDQTSDDEVLDLLDRAHRPLEAHPEFAVRILSEEAGIELDGDLTVPPGARGLVIFAHGSGSSRFSPRNRFVGRRFNEEGFATLLLDLLTREEEALDDATRELRFDIPLLARRVDAAIDWARSEPATIGLPIGLFGASTGAAAALVAATQRPGDVDAVVSRGGRPDLAGALLPDVQAPTLLIVGGKDEAVLAMNAGALEGLGCEKSLYVVPEATHLFEEPGALEEVADVASGWFARHLAARPSRSLARPLP